LHIHYDASKIVTPTTGDITWNEKYRPNS
jgi:hypothetical protein